MPERMNARSKPCSELAHEVDVSADDWDQLAKKGTMSKLQTLLPIDGKVLFWRTFQTCDPL